jgi:SNF2 family DNA or RNA helicase
LIIQDKDLYVENLVATCGKFQLLRRMLKRLRENGHKVLIFSQMTRMLDILEDFMDLEGYDYCRIDGTTKQEERQERIAVFNNDESVFVVLLSTRAGG